jgi:hypothetical protein
MRRFPGSPLPAMIHQRTGKPVRVNNPGKIPLNEKPFRIAVGNPERFGYSR